MIIAVASGKGGTGKTTIATNLVLSLEGSVRLLDCDVEEPNAHLFLKPRIESTTSIGIPVPCVDELRCTACGKCGQICQYSAIVALKTKPLTFPELCHGCGGCARICPSGAITEVSREIGTLEKGRSGNVEFVHGRLKIGEAMSPPLIRAVKKYIRQEGATIIDAPPGTSCPVIATVKDSDFVILVTEPTPFGLNDLMLAVEMIRELGTPFGVLINRADLGDDRVRDYCRAQGIQVLLEISNDRKIAEAYSKGILMIEVRPGLIDTFRELYARIGDIVSSGGSKGLPYSSEKGEI
ncbi:MAG: ATP-binding protein [bacterium]